jgi:hypothetical protein
MRRSVPAAAIQFVVMREARLEAITVRPVDRYRLLKTSDR